MLIRFAVVAVVALLAACRGSEVERVVRTQTESGTPWVQNRGSGTWASNEAWDPREVLRLGTVEGAGPESFGLAWDITPIGGRVAILDLQGQDVRVFNADGSHHVSFGRRGDGPGEFAFADGLITDEQGRLWVADVRRPALLRFDESGGFVESRTYAMGLGVPERMTSSSAVAWLFDLPDRDYTSDFIGPRIQVRPVRWDLDTGDADTLPGVVAEFAMVSDDRVPFSATIHTTPASNAEEFWFSDARSYRATKRSLSGDSLLVISLEDAVAAAIPDRVADSLATSAEVRAAIPARYPAIDQLLTDGAGHLFVFPHLEGYGRGTVLDVFAEDNGTYLGRVVLPHAIERRPAPVARPGRLLAGFKDELGVDFVVQYELAAKRGQGSSN